MDRQYLDIILKRLDVCRAYQPRFGQKGRSGLTLTAFRELYGADPFYGWFGLDNPLVYAAHRAAGGITSIYRQVGIGCELVFRRILQDSLGLSAEQVRWSYLVGSTQRRLQLDARIAIEDVGNVDRRRLLRSWLTEAARHLDIDAQVSAALKGLVFEVRQGYKSKDSKRQNADMSNAAAAYTQGYLPVLLLLSQQIDQDIAERYIRGKWLLLMGSLTDAPLRSTYAFCSQVIGYDLAAFFEHNAARIRQYMEEVLVTLLSADD